jgi:hypothetical protein
MVVYLNEPIQVGAVFKKSGVVPRWFLYHGKKIRIQEVTYVWKENVGQALYHHFSVSDGMNLYDLMFQPERLYWRLAAIEDAAP